MIYKFENPTIPSAKILRNTTKTFPRFLQPNLSTYYSHTRNPILSTEFKLPTLFGNNFSQLDQVLTNRGSFPRRTKLTRVRRSFHVPSELLAFLAFLKVHERARARTRTRSRDPGLLWTRIAWPLSGNSHSPKRKLIHHARIPPVISGRVTNYSSPSSHHGRPSSCRDRSPSLPPPPFLSLSKNFAQNSTLFLFIYFLPYRHESLVFSKQSFGQPPPLAGRRPTCFSPLLYSSTRSLIAQKKSRTSGHHLFAAIRSNPSLARTRWKGEAGIYLFLFFFY